jgi:hypothetical protein
VHVTQLSELGKCGLQAIVALFCRLLHADKWWHRGPILVYKDTHGCKLAVNGRHYMVKVMTLTSVLPYLGHVLHLDNGRAFKVEEQVPGPFYLALPLHQERLNHTC